MADKERLDKRICDCEKGSKNAQTYREFIRESEKRFGIKPSDIDLMDESELKKYLNYIDELWDK